MIRRLFWLTSGMALGAGGTLWVRRRLELAAVRLRPARLAQAAGGNAQRRVEKGLGRLSSAMQAGREQARIREDELRRQLSPR